ncbi:hypothetical protein EC968_005914 [Mortierella alpina]|nr:hypothetical protein EC968_005914 [Mortierella alpina]
MTLPLVNVPNDLEYYGSVSVGTRAQTFKLDFDTGGSQQDVELRSFDVCSSDIWFPSSSCTATACKKHARFSSAASSTYQKDGRSWAIPYGDGSSASGFLGSDLVNVGDISVRQTIGLATRESTQFGSSPEDGLFGLVFDTIESAVSCPNLLSRFFLPSVRRNGGIGGEHLFGGIDSSKYSASLIYVPVTKQGCWQILVQDASYNGASLGQTSQGIIDTGTNLLIVGDATAAAIHKNVPGSINDPDDGWLVPCSVSSSTDNVGFVMGGKTFNVPVADLAYEDLGDGSGNCYSGIQGGQDGLWILGDVFIKNNYCVFSKTSSPSIGIAPLAY